MKQFETFILVTLLACSWDLSDTSLVAILFLPIVLIKLHKNCFVLISNLDFLQCNRINILIHSILEHFNFLLETCPPSGQK